MPRDDGTKYAVDTENGNKVGVIQRRYAGSVYLRPPGGGTEWATPPKALRHPTADELRQANILDTPIGGQRQ